MVKVVKHYNISNIYYQFLALSIPDNLKSSECKVFVQVYDFIVPFI